jgi:ribose transport system substrate-binding protein
LRGTPSRALDAILISPVSDVTLLSMLHVAAQAGVAWVFLNRWNDAIRELRQHYPKVAIFSVSADQEQVGTLQGRQILRLWRPGDECVYIQGPLGTSSARRRFEGAQQQLSASAVPMTVLHSDWSRAGGMRVMAQWLEMLNPHSRTRLIVAAQNDSMAMGAREAFEQWSARSASGVVRASLLGCDGSPSFGQLMVQTGRLVATVVIPPVAGAAIEQLVRYFRSGWMPPAEITLPVRSYPGLEEIAPPPGV